MHSARPGPQAVPGDVKQINSANHLQHGEQHHRLLDDQPDAQQRITHVQQNTQPDTRSRQQRVAPVLGQGLAQHHRKIRAGACHGQQVHQGHRKKFQPVILHLFAPVNVVTC